MPYTMTQKVLSGVGQGFSAIKTGDWEYSELVKGFCSGYSNVHTPISMINNNFKNRDKNTNFDTVQQLGILTWEIFKTARKSTKILMNCWLDPLSKIGFLVANAANLGLTFYRANQTRQI